MNTDRPKIVLLYQSLLGIYGDHGNAVVLTKRLQWRGIDAELVTVEPGVIEAARAMGAGPWRILFDVVAREALGPLILGYTYILIAIVDMTAIAGALGGGGLGQFAITYGYQRYDWTVTAVAVVTIIIVVQLAQFLGNWLARRALRR